jgi:outer membrane receptor protein involved in Fe transport
MQFILVQIGFRCKRRWSSHLQRVNSAVYGNYIFENKTWEAELGLRVEYVKIQYGEDHPVYTSDSYNYAKPFNFRLLRPILLPFNSLCIPTKNGRY